MCMCARVCVNAMVGGGEDDDDDDDGDSSVGGSRAAGGRDIGYLIDRIYSYLGHDRPIPLKSHRRGVVALRKACQSEQTVEQEGATKLVFVVLALLRRIISVHGVTTPEEAVLNPDDESVIEAVAFQRTLMLTFLLIARVDANSVVRHGDDNDSGDEDDDATDEDCVSSTTCLWQHLSKASKKRSRDEGSSSNDDANAGDVSAGAEASEPVLLTALEKMDQDKGELDDLIVLGWNMNPCSSTWNALLHSPQALAREHLARGGRVVRRGQFHHHVGLLDELALRFARATTESFQTKFLCPKNDDDILSLHASGIDVNSEESTTKLQTLALNADSESGMVTYRDLLCSFLLPTNFIGRRRVLLLDRESSTRATREFAHIVALSHDSAMAGISAAFGSNNELKSTCALLAGLAMLTTNKGQDMLRRSHAFGGVVQLPFLETKPPENGMRIVLLPARRTWVTYSLDHRGAPIVHVAKRGFEGLCLSALVLLS